MKCMLKYLNCLTLSLVLFVGFGALAAGPNKAAPQGGNFNYNLRSEPSTLHPIKSSDAYASEVQAYVFDTLLTRDADTWAWKSRIAEKWEISKDNKTFTFWLRKNVVFHDGKPLTAEDVKFSFDAIFEPKYEAAHLRPYYEGLEKVEIVDPYTVKFTTKDTYYMNFNVAATLTIIPKHIYSDVEKSNKMNFEAVGSGPYVLEKMYKGQRLVLKKFDKWYGNTLEDYKGFFNFGTITMRFVKDENVYLEMLKKGDLDFDILSNEQYMKKTEGPGWDKNVVKVKTTNSAPKSYGFYGWNLRLELFKDKNVRVALAHLMNREEMNKKFRFGMSLLATGPMYQQSDYASPKSKAIPFDPKKAQELLANAGWKDSDKDGILDKTINGKKVDFKFTLLHPNKDTEKYHTLYKEDLKKAGIEMDIKLSEWNSFLKSMDDANFEVVALSWTGSMDWDPKQIWHSSSAVAGGSNFVGYKNPAVDKLIDKARVEQDRTKRVALLREVYEKIADDAPYAFWFNEQFSNYMHNKRIGKNAETFKYDLATDHWWLTK
jgi:microcin C transport system substrate-binding protein